jgi:hypothetical protein
MLLRVLVGGEDLYELRSAVEEFPKPVTIYRSGHVYLLPRWWRHYRTVEGQVRVNPKVWAAAGAVLAGTLALSAGFAIGPAAAPAGAHPTTTTTTVATTTTTTTPPSAPQIITSDFVCSNGVCAIGPGDAGMPFAAGMVGTGGPAYGGPECNPCLMTVSSGSLPPGLQLSEPVCEWVVNGTPTNAGTYTFTVEVSPQPDEFGNPRGPAGFQQFSITIGTGSADHLLVFGATYSPTKYILHVGGFDVNNGATYSIYTCTGTLLATLTEKTPANGGDGNFGLSQHRTNAASISPLTVTDGLGSSVTVPIVFEAP